jgi:hypothetical protein
LEFARLARLTCAAFNIRLATYTWSVLATGSGNAGTCEKLHDQSRIRFRQKAGVCASGLRWLGEYRNAFLGDQLLHNKRSVAQCVIALTRLIFKSLDKIA